MGGCRRRLWASGSLPRGRPVDPPSVGVEHRAGLVRIAQAQIRLSAVGASICDTSRTSRRDFDAFYSSTRSRRTSPARGGPGSHGGAVRTGTRATWHCGARADDARVGTRVVTYHALAGLPPATSWPSRSSAPTWCDRIRFGSVRRVQVQRGSTPEPGLLGSGAGAAADGTAPSATTAGPRDERRRHPRRRSTCPTLRLARGCSVTSNAQKRRRGTTGLCQACWCYPWRASPSRAPRLPCDGAYANDARLATASRRRRALRATCSGFIRGHLRMPVLRSPGQDPRSANQSAAPRRWLRRAGPSPTSSPAST